MIKFTQKRNEETPQQTIASSFDDALNEALASLVFDSELSDSQRVYWWYDAGKTAFSFFFSFHQPQGIACSSVTVGEVRTAYNASRGDIRRGEG